MDHGCQKRLWALTLGTVLGLLMSMELLEFGLNILPVMRWSQAYGDKGGRLWYIWVSNWQMIDLWRLILVVNLIGYGSSLKAQEHQ